MSNFLGLTPTLRIQIENPFLLRIYPSKGSVLTVIDTGYEGFLTIPKMIYEELELHSLVETKRSLTLADGKVLSSRGAYASLRIPDPPCTLDGFIETYEGLDEVILGVQALSHFKVTIDYCSMRLRLEKCSNS